MDNKIMIVFKDRTNLTDSILYLMEQEKIECMVSIDFNGFNEDITGIIYIDQKNDELDEQLGLLSIPVLIISDEKRYVKNGIMINYIVTNLINDNDEYTDVQLEYLFKKGLYSILNSNIMSFFNRLDKVNGLAIDITGCEVTPSDWTFKFDSIAETYNWLKKKRKSGNIHFVKKEMNFYNSDKVYNDSSKEINYLINKIMNIKDGEKIMDTYVCTRAELEKFKNNYFFKSLLANLSSTYNMYYIDKDEVLANEPQFLEKCLDGLIIYEDCVYRDTYDDEYSLGYVNCSRETIIEYNEYFDYILDKYGKKLNSDGDIDGI